MPWTVFCWAASRTPSRATRTVPWRSCGFRRAVEEFRRPRAGSGGELRADVALRNFGDVAGAGEAHGHFEFAVEMLEHGLHAHPSAEGQAIEHGTSDGDDVRAERQGLENVLPAADAAVNDDGGAALH